MSVSTDTGPGVPDNLIKSSPPSADHHICDGEGFRTAVCDAARLSDGNQLITFGIVPDAPETCYGYIRAGKPISGSNAAGVDEFVEKPDATRAAEFVDAGGYYWNSGMFMFKARTYLAELNRFRPDIHQACERAASGEVPDLDFSRPDKCFADCPSESIDYAVMEHTDKSVVLPVDFGWSDVGSWHALWATGEKDPDGNDFHGDVISVDTRGTYIHADKRLVAAVGVDDPGGGRDCRCGTCRTSRRRPGSKAGCCQYQGSYAARASHPYARLPPVGKLRDGRGRAALPGQADHGEPGR